MDWNSHNGRRGGEGSWGFGDPLTEALADRRRRLFGERCDPRLFGAADDDPPWAIERYLEETDDDEDEEED